jgi:hypothetical protein
VTVQWCRGLLVFAHPTGPDPMRRSLIDHTPPEKGVFSKAQKKIRFDSVQEQEKLKKRERSDRGQPEVDIEPT